LLLDSNMRNSFGVIIALLSLASTFDLFDTNSFPWNLIRTGAMENRGPPTLDTLHVNVLREICQMVDEARAPSDFVNPEFEGQKPLAPLSKTSQFLRDVSIPDLFREVEIRGGWIQISKKLDKLKNCPAVTHYTKYATSPNLNHELC